MGAGLTQIIQVQALRAIAALAVALCHFDQLRMMLYARPNEKFPLYPLAAGVDLFFIISGFVMVISSQKLFGSSCSTGIFFRKRIARIVPVYWLTTLVAIPAFGRPIDFAHFLGSLFFIPARNAAGHIVPINGVGWTLNFEMFFYLIFALLLPLRRELSIVLCAAILLGLVVIGHFSRFTNPALLVWSDPLVIEFVVGMALAVVYQKNLSLPLWARLGCIVIGVAGIWFYPASGNVPSGFRAFGWGIPAALIFAGAVFVRRDRPPENWFGTTAVVWLGDYSYSLYLIHPLVGAAIFLSWGHGLSRFPVPLVLFLGLVAAVGASALLFHFFEKPMQQRLQIWRVPKMRSAN
jgi:peptidoglycan/LPS O-acetylase OafA/YrhL